MPLRLSRAVDNRYLHNEVQSFYPFMFIYSGEIAEEYFIVQAHEICLTTSYSFSGLQSACSV